MFVSRTAPSKQSTLGSGNQEHLAERCTFRIATAPPYSQSTPGTLLERIYNANLNMRHDSRLGMAGDHGHAATNHYV